MEYAAGLGFRTSALSHTKLSLGEGYAGIAALEQWVIHKVNLSNQATNFLRSPSFGQEGFVSYYCIPLITKGKTQGVLEIFKRSLINPNSERWDGSGYPSGLKGEQIPFPARLFAVVDVFDTLVSDRPFRSVWSKQAALDHIQEGAGSLFDPAIATTFLKLVKENGFSN